MAKVVVAAYKKIDDAHSVVRRLIDEGYAPEEVSILSHDAQGRFREYLQVEQAKEAEKEEFIEGEVVEDSAETGAGLGAGIGAIIGVLAGAAMWFVPPFGGFLVAGPLATLIGGALGAGAGAAAGGIAGGLVGALLELGVPEERAEPLAEAVRKGATLVAVEAPANQADDVVEIMDDFHPVDVEERLSQHKDESWTGVEPEPEEEHVAKPLPEEDFEDYAPTEYSQGFGAFDDLYREHYAAELANSGHDYEYYLPAYAYGYDLATDEQFRHADWEQIAGEARQRWETYESPGPWEEFESPIRYAYEEIQNWLNA